MTTSVSQVRQNYHQDSEAAINRQINLELYASYVYLSMVRPGAVSPGGRAGKGRVQPLRGGAEVVATLPPSFPRQPMCALWENASQCWGRLLQVSRDLSCAEILGISPFPTASWEGFLIGKGRLYAPFYSRGSPFSGNPGTAPLRNCTVLQLEGGVLHFHSF